MDANTTIIKHHGAGGGVTGSRHELALDDGASLLIDCGLFQGGDRGDDGAHAGHLDIGFDIEGVQALVITHVHLDHVGRIPWLLAAGFDGPIYCSEPSAELLPIMLEDAFKLGISRQPQAIQWYLKRVGRLIRPLPFGRWHSVYRRGGREAAIRLRRAGHVLGSAYVECALTEGDQDTRPSARRAASFSRKGRAARWSWMVASMRSTPVSIPSAAIPRTPTATACSTSSPA